MDAYDIFKKLSKGAKYTVNSLFRKAPQIIAPAVTVKVEKTEDTKSIKKPIEPSNSIVLLNGIKADSGRKQGKKRKHPEDREDDKKRKLAEEEVNHYRNVNNISVVGRHIPEPARSFGDFKVDGDIIDNLRKCGYVEPTAVQKQAVAIMLDGRQLLSCAPTGSGKTAAFLVPLLQDLKGPKKEGFRALILCPTRELAKQTQRECLRLSEGREFRVHIISKIKKALSQYGPNSSQKYDILIATPNRICYLLKQDPPALSLSNVEWLVIDEADKLFEEGNRSFRDQLNEILLACTCSKRKIAMFSATHTPVVAKWCVRNMKGLVRLTVGQRNTATDLVDQKLIFVGNEHGKLIELRDVIRKGVNPPVLIFVQSKERAQQLFQELIYDGKMVAVISSELTQLQRDNTVKGFREGKIWILICTELMARGIDFKGVNLVINYDFPPSAISYVHRVGRAGRAGRRGEAITFFTMEDAGNLRSIAHVLKDSGCEVPQYMLTLKKESRRKKKLVGAPKREDILTKLTPWKKLQYVKKDPGEAKKRFNNSHKNKTVVARKGKEIQKNKDVKKTKDVKKKTMKRKTKA